MQAPTQIRPPKNWQDFEMLCKKLWGEIWNCADTIKRNGRSGQNQCGVDIYAIPNGKTQYYGIQCKGKDHYVQAHLTIKEIDEEITKARNFQPALGAFYFATTAVKDVRIEEYIREKNVESIRNGSFRIEVFCWEDIVDLLKQYRATYNWYINNCQYTDSSDVSVVFKNNQSTLEIHPQYKVCSRLYNFFRQFVHHLQQLPFPTEKVSLKPMIDCTWCNVPIVIKNIGSTVLQDFMIQIQCTSKNKFDVDDDYGGKRVYGMIVHNFFDIPHVVIDEETMSIEFRPTCNQLVQTDQCAFNFWIRPSQLEQTIILDWNVKSADYNKQGKLYINSCAELYKGNRNFIDTDNLESLHIEPKIIEQ